jgi:hypothetical protein
MKFRNKGNPRSYSQFNSPDNQGIQLDSDTLRMLESSPSTRLVEYRERILQPSGEVEERTLEG